MDEAWAKQWRIAALYLHGSRAQGRERPDSDYDVAVLLEDPPSDWQVLEDLRSEIALRLAPELGSCSADRIDVVFLHQAPLAFQFRAIRPGKILWEAPGHARVRFETRLLAEYHDYQHFEDIHNQAMRQRLKEGSFGNRPTTRATPPL